MAPDLGIHLEIGIDPDSLRDTLGTQEEITRVTETEEIGIDPLAEAEISLAIWEAEITPEPVALPGMGNTAEVSASPGIIEIDHLEEITLELVLAIPVNLAETGEISQGLEITLGEGKTRALLTETDLSLGEERDTDPLPTTQETGEITLGDLSPEISLRATLTGVTLEINLGAGPKNLSTDILGTGRHLVLEITLEAETSLRR